MPKLVTAPLLALVTAAIVAFCPLVAAESSDAPIIEPAPRTINLTQEQRFIIKEILLKDVHVAKARADAPETIGEAVPPSIELHAMPSLLAEKVPQGRSHSWFVKEGDNVIVLVSPNDHRVADVIR